MNNLDEARLDRGHFSVVALAENDDQTYWLSRSFAERWEAIELLRQTTYGYDPARTRLQTVLTVTQLGQA